MKKGAATLKESLAAVGAGNDDGVILFLQELRSHEIFSNLVEKVNYPNLRMVACSAFRSYDNRLEWQQCGIASTLPVIDASWSRWRRNKNIVPPRGYTYALLDGGKDGLIACFCTHLKSNYGATSIDLVEKNRTKRENPMEQFLEICKRLKDPEGRKVTKIIIAGDFNTDVYSNEFKDEKTITMLTDAGFVNCHSRSLAEDRITHPGRGKFAGTTLDYVLFSGFSDEWSTTIRSGAVISDHEAIFVKLKSGAETAAPKKKTRKRKPKAGSSQTPEAKSADDSES